MKLYTRGGDAGETSLFGGDRVRKDDPRIWAYGEVDELNSALGLAVAELPDEDSRARLRRVQSELFDVCAELATPDLATNPTRARSVPRVGQDEVDALERWIDELEDEVAPLTHFVLPGGSRAAATLHLARTICRRAERRVVAFAAETPLSPALVRYLNRLSDLLFALARAANARAGVPEPVWVGRERAGRDG
jgi:cob(I)alamin adenosyltransferase